MWPALPYNEWKYTLDTLHMWMEIVGKVKLELAPFVNQWWEVAFYITPTGITTGKIPYKDNLFQIDFDFSEHILTISTSWEKTRSLSLQPQSVAAFYQQFMQALDDLGIYVSIWPVPVETPHPIPFENDTEHEAYDKKFVERWWHVLAKVTIIFERFRTPFRGKSSPIHFFWGSFDLNGARFSGKKTTPPKATGVMKNIIRYSENEENFAFGFWPGDESTPYPAFYSYMYPKPPGMELLKISNEASFNEQIGGFLLRYETVRKEENPATSILHFLESSYQKTAKLAKWDIQSFQTDVPMIH